MEVDWTNPSVVRPRDSLIGSARALPKEKGSVMRLFWFAVVCILIGSSAVWADEIQLENGDKMDVKILSEDDDKLVVEHPQLGEMTIPKSDLKKPDPPNPGLFGTKFMEGWARSVGFGFSGASGNSDDASVNGSLAFSNSTKSYRSNFQARYFYSSQQGVANTNSFTGTYNHDFLFGESPLYIFALARYQFDEYQVWRNRIGANAGVGYEFLRGVNYLVSTQLGFGVAYTTGSDDDNNGVIEQRETRPEGVVGLVGSWKPFKGHELSADITYYPDFADLPRFRLLANAAYQIALAPIDGLALKFGVQNEYDSGINTSLPVPGSPPAPNQRFQKKNNLKYSGNLVYEF